MLATAVQRRSHSVLAVVLLVLAAGSVAQSNLLAARAPGHCPSRVVGSSAVVC